jgi:hypothetical protein
VTSKNLSCFRPFLRAILPFNIAFPLARILFRKEDVWVLPRLLIPDESRFEKCLSVGICLVSNGLLAGQGHPLLQLPFIFALLLEAVSRGGGGGGGVISVGAYLERKFVLLR